MKKLLQSRIGRWLILPLSAALLGLFIGSASAFLPAWLCLVGMVVFLVGVVYLLVMTVVWLVKKRWRMAVGALACLVACFLALAPAFSLAFVTGMAMEDHFADNLKLPEGVELAEPGSIGAGVLEEVSARSDPFQHAQKTALLEGGLSEAIITPSVPALGELHRKHPNLLRQYLAAHPAWWFHVHGRYEFATRRWRVDGRWEAWLHGYHSSFSEAEGPRYQTRTCLGLSGRPWFAKAQELTPGRPVKIDLFVGNRMQESRVFWLEDGIAVELFEQGETVARRMTRAAIKALQEEFAALLKNPTWEHAKTLLPPDSIARGEPSFVLRRGMQGGIYAADIQCNPGEPGRLYLKVFEITQNTPLSANEIKGRSTEFIGWSKDPRELFRAHVQFTVYEGNWGQYYGARIEVWFTPESGQSERRLMESNWKIEGWMH